MKMRVAAVVALVFCLLGLALDLALYAARVFHLGFAATMQSLLWPLSAAIRSVPVLALSVGILLKESGRGG